MRSAYETALLAAATTCFVQTVAFGQAAAPPDRETYTLLNPTPRALWRPLSADRPDITESPQTVDAGAVQLETSFFEYVHDSINDDAATSDSLSLAFSTLKLGLTHDMDLQFVFAPFVRAETRADGTGVTDVQEGPSDLTVRLKWNLWGNDEGKTALGLLPFVKIPTGSSVSNDRVEGGVAVPFSWDIREGLSLGLMGELDILFDESSGKHDLAFLHTVVVGADVYGPIGAYVEYAGRVHFDGDRDYEAVASVGLTYEINENAVLDAGTFIGLTRPTDDVVVFSGITLRF